MRRAKRMIDFPSIADHILIWIFGIILPFLSGLQSDKLNGEIRFDAESRKKLYLGNSIMLAVAGSVIILLWYFKDRTWASMGFQMPQWNNRVVVITAIILLSVGYLTDLIYTYFFQREEGDEWFHRSSFLPQHYRELPAYVLLCCCAGIFEEIIYRGFMVNYFLEEVRETVPWLALIVPSILFSLAHFYQGWGAVMKIFILAMLLNLIFIYTQSLFPTMIIHFLIDLLSGLAGMRKMKSNQ
ncbi:MAG: CPBP family intramembrane glutamic endopeptidase [Chitinophagia bacterium]